MKGMNEMNEKRCERGEEEGGPPESSQQTFVLLHTHQRRGLGSVRVSLLFHSFSPFSCGSFVRQPRAASGTPRGQDLFSFHKTQRSERRSSSKFSSSQIVGRPSHCSSVQSRRWSASHVRPPRVDRPLPCPRRLALTVNRPKVQPVTKFSDQWP